MEYIDFEAKEIPEDAIENFAIYIKLNLMKMVIYLHFIL